MMRCIAGAFFVFFAGSSFAASAEIDATPGKGFTVSTTDGAYALTLRPRLQLRSTTVVVPNDDATAWDATHELRAQTLRLVTSGHVLSKDFTWNVQLAFGAGDYEVANASPIFDAWAELSTWKFARVRVGQFFVPFDRARTVRELGLQFTDRQQVVKELTLDRDVGVMVHSPDVFENGFFGYAAFVGTGEGRNRIGGTDPAPLVVGRVFTRPLGAFDDDVEGDLKREPRPRVAVGVAGAFNPHASRALSTNGPAFAAGAADATNVVVDVVVKAYGVSLLAEAVARQWSVDEVRGIVDGKEVVTPTRSGAGAFVQAGFMVTDHLELVGRYEHLVPLGDTDPALITFADAQGQQAGGGVNLYLNGHALKLQADTMTVFGSAGVDRQIARLQLDATF